ncbi:hypothetical protein ACVNPZ_14740 [Staphylococcus aureus]
MPWKELDIDIAIDATGKFNHGDKAIAHIKAGAKKVLLTGPSKGGHVQMVVKGVNDNQLDMKHLTFLVMLHVLLIALVQLQKFSSFSWNS